VDEIRFETSYEVSEADFVGLLAKMIRNENYHFPLSIAEREYRQASYQMSSASQLEDLFIDSLETYIRQEEPSIQFVRAHLGEREWDYRVNGLTISHKAMFKVCDIALNWDATLGWVTHNSKYPFLIDLARCSPKVIRTINSGKKQSFEILNSESVQKSQRIYLSHWTLGGELSILENDFPRFISEDFIDNGALFKRLWTSLLSAKKDFPINELDFLLTNADIEVGKRFTILDKGFLRSGFYLIPRDLLQGLPVTANNKAQLTKAKTVKGLMAKTIVRQFVVPTTSWIQYFVTDLKKDLYVKQRSQYEDIIRKFTN
jgi:hypothetical protein